MESSKIIPDPSVTSGLLGLREAIEHSMASFFLSRPDGTILDVNQAAVDLFGRSKEEIKQMGRDGLFDRLGPFLGMEIHRKQQEDLLRRIAWEQSHLVRAPLARLLGLVDLIRHGQETGADVDYMLSQIVSSALELDDIIRGISSSTAKLPSKPTS